MQTLGVSGAQITVDPAATRRRIGRLRNYVDKTLLSGDEFLCEHAGGCRASAKSNHQFREGVMSHVGRRYDLAVRGKPLRIMVVGQESGLPADPNSPWASRVTLSARHQQVHDDSGLQRRYYASGDYPGRNPHMRGTTSLLRIILGAGAGVDYDGEFVQPANGRRFHCFDGFALVNRLLCSTGPMGTSNGSPTSAMFKNCGGHFVTTVSILEPTLVILQGKAVANSVQPLLASSRTYDEHLQRAHIGNNSMLVCSFSHPSSRGAQRWGDKPNAEYLQQVVAPTIRNALARLKS